MADTNIIDSLKLDMPAFPPVKTSGFRTSQEAAKEAMRIEPEVEKAKGQAELEKRKLDLKVLQDQTKKEKEYNDRLQKNFEDYQRSILPDPAFHPTEENVQSLASLFSLVATAGLMVGSTGKVAATGAMDAMTGMLKGWRAGRADQFKQYKDTFDREVARIKQTNDKIREHLEMRNKLAATDRDEAMKEGELAIRIAGTNSVLGANMLAGHWDKAANILDGVEKQLFQLEKITATAKERASYEKPMFKQAEITLKDGSKIVGAFEEHSGKYFTSTGQQISGDEIKSVTTPGAASGRGQFQQLMIAQRTITALRGAASAAESLTKLPAGTRVGMLPFLGDRDGLLAYVKNASGRKISSEEAKEMDTLYTGVSRYLAQIESMGAATGLVGLSKQLESLKPMTGDTVKNAALKLADIRRISTESVSALVESGLLPEQMSAAAVEQVNRMDKAIPFTTQDVVEATTKGRRTLGQQSAEAVRGLTDAEKARKAELEAKSRAAQ
jgi:hypothetical protein